ncbi:MAG: DUF962 domain-containing protein [Candidatus Thermoplasmatota archaeon]
MEKAYRTLDAFWPFYLREHSKPLTIALHVVGSLLSLGLLVGFAALAMWWWLLLVLPVGYGFAWFAHFVVQRNRPATFTYPWFSFASDWRLVWVTLTGRLGREREKHVLR